MVSLRSGKKVPFLGKNIPKRPYSYKKPIPTADENELISKIGSISIHEPSYAPEDTKSEMDGADVNINNDTYGSMPSLEGSKAEELENFDTSDDETNVESEVEIDTTDLPDETVGIIQKFETKMGKAPTQPYSPLIRAIPTFLDSSDASESAQDSTLSDSSQDLTEDSVLISDVSAIDVELYRFDKENEKRQQSLFSDNSSASSLSSTLQTMIDKAIDSELSSSDEED